MTTQIQDRLDFEDGAIDITDFKNYELGAIRTGDIDDPDTWRNYCYSARPDPTRVKRCSALWRGYTCTYLLRRDGTLHLKWFGYHVWSMKHARFVQVDEQLVGDFWLVMDNDFDDGQMLIPFTDGHIDIDRIYGGAGFSPRSMRQVR